MFRSTNKNVNIIERFGEPLSERKTKVQNILETRTSISSEEIETAFDDLYMDESFNGAITLEILASWLGTTEDVVLRSLPKHLSIDEDGYVNANW